MIFDHRSVDVSLWDDPVELRMRLDAALVEIAELTQENNRLRRQLGLGVPDPTPERHAPGDGGDQPVVLEAPRPGQTGEDSRSAAEIGRV